MSKVYLDMDDTLVDFRGGLAKFNITHERYFHMTPRSQWTPLQKKLDKVTVDCMNTPNFFRNLPLIDGAIDLWKTAKHPYILTAWPKTCLDRERVKREKREWLYDNFGEVSDDRFIYCAREDKAKYAPGNILVDDMVANIEAWEKAGGIGILFTNSNQAISDLKRAMND